MPSQVPGGLSWLTEAWPWLRASPGQRGWPQFAPGFLEALRLGSGGSCCLQCSAALCFNVAGTLALSLHCGGSACPSWLTLTLRPLVPVTARVRGVPCPGASRRLGCCRADELMTSAGLQGRAELPASPDLCPAVGVCGQFPFACPAGLLLRYCSGASIQFGIVRRRLQE